MLDTTDLPESYLQEIADFFEIEYEQVDTKHIWRYERELLADRADSLRDAGKYEDWNR